jgi:hypothetical protein
MKPVTDVMREIRGGVFANECSDQLSELVQRCYESGRKGKITITLEVVPKPGSSNRMMTVKPSVKTTLPPRPDTDEASIFYAVRGDLVRDDPDQKKLAFKDEMAERRVANDETPVAVATA